MQIGIEYYKYYPKIREEDIGTNTSNLFVDTMNISNAYLKSMCADFDGDQITVKGVYTEDANRELENFRDTNRQDFIDVGCTPLRPICSDVCNTIFALTRVLSNMRITDSKNIEFG